MRTFEAPVKPKYYAKTVNKLDRINRLHYWKNMKIGDEQVISGMARNSLRESLDALIKYELPTYRFRIETLEGDNRYLVRRIHKHPQAKPQQDLKQYVIFDPLGKITHYTSKRYDTDNLAIGGRMEIYCDNNEQARKVVNSLRSKMSAQYGLLNVKLEIEELTVKLSILRNKRPAPEPVYWFNADSYEPAND